MEKVVFFWGVIVTSIAVDAQEAVIVPFGEAPLIEQKFDHDPSLDAVSNDIVTVQNPNPFLERWRVVTDLNNDGVEDLILSDPREKPWTYETSWMVYVHTNSVWVYQGDVIFRPDMVTFEQTYNGVNIWKYTPISGHEGFLGYNRFADGKLDRRPNRMHIVYEDENDCIFFRLNNAVFGHPSTQPFRLESSETSTNGVVSWKFVRDERTPCRKSEVYELKQRVAELEKRANEAESQLRRTKGALDTCTRGMFEFGDITLGGRWDGGATNRFCTEVFSGFTNLTVLVDSNNFVSAIRLTRQGRMPTDAAPGVSIHSAPTDDEQKIIHQIENHFNIRLQYTTFQKKRVFYWANPFLGNWVKASFAREGETESRIEMRYSRNLGESPLP